MEWQLAICQKTWENRYSVIAAILPRTTLIGGGGKIPDMIWPANWGFGGGFKIITNKKTEAGFITGGPFF
jgi:hypothetical protein